MSKPTWEFLTGDDGAVIYSDAGTVATISPDLIAHKANARLIAAAPDLLAALETLTKMVEDGDWTTVELNDARAAIAKAEGRG